MKLEIVWRNPNPPAKTVRRVATVVVDRFGTVYAVIGAGQTFAFELILGGAA